MDGQAQSAIKRSASDDELDAILNWGESGASEDKSLDDEDKSSGIEDEVGNAQKGDEVESLDIEDEVGNAHKDDRALAVMAPSANGDDYFTATEYDPALEEKEYSRSLLAKQDLAILKDELAENGFMTIAQVRSLVQQNCVKETQEARGETYAIDPEMMMQIDARINYRIFITGDNVYTREELLEHHPFENFQTSPEDVFVQQEVGVFPPKQHAMDDAGYEYVARDLGDDEEFIMIEDLVGRAARANYTMKREPIRIVKTKVFLGKEKWSDFTKLKRFVRSFKSFVAPMMIASQGGDAKAAKALAGLFAAGPAGGPLALQDAEGVRQERERAALAALEAKARELQEREEELRAREAALYESLGLGAPSRPERDFMAEAHAANDAPADDSVAL